IVVELRERSGARAFPMPDVDDRAVGRKVESAFVGRSRFSRDRLLAEMRAAAASKLRRAGQHHTKLVLVVVILVLHAVAMLQDLPALGCLDQRQMLLTVGRVSPLEQEIGILV